MAISLKSIISAFFLLIVYYGLYSVITNTTDIFSASHSNLFDVFLVALLPLILFAAVILSAFFSEERGYRG